jgi:hypothetical protein
MNDDRAHNKIVFSCQDHTEMLVRFNFCSKKMDD